MIMITITIMRTVIPMIITTIMIIITTTTIRIITTSTRRKISPPPCGEGQGWGSGGDALMSTLEKALQAVR
jgi:hypothetical protein